ncbi:hypothetical protein KCP76_22075 [Salmonella enterica subsp. enterica serovar Weltevreden]|nr:hypothetical protein KCP76_22075 [Salmonella enterica subsp. enterica serovar Weltevreden]
MKVEAALLLGDALNTSKRSGTEVTTSTSSRFRQRQQSGAYKMACGSGNGGYWLAMAGGEHPAVRAFNLP